MKIQKTGKSKGHFMSFLSEMRKNGIMYLMFLPAGVFFFLFNYMPLFGLILAFKNFSFREGIFNSPWIHPIYENFRYLFKSGDALRASRNTLLLNFLFIGVGLILQVGLALLFNELRNLKLKKSVQFSIFLPYFISWIVVGVFSYNLFNYENGILNTVLEAFGREPFNWYMYPKLWILIILLFYIWKGTGYGMVMYIAGLSGIDPTYYEAAKLDGANRFHQMRYVSLPMLMPTIITLTLLNCGRIMNSDFGMFYSIIGNNSQLYETMDVIDTFIYRNLRINGDIGMSSAAAFYQSILSSVILITMNKIARRIDPDSGLF